MAAPTRLAALEAAIADLTDNPTTNRTGPVAGLRTLIAQRHRVSYWIRPDRSGRPEGGDVIVLRIYGPGQND